MKAIKLNSAHLGIKNVWLWFSLTRGRLREFYNFVTVAYLDDAILDEAESISYSALIT